MVKRSLLTLTVAIVCVAGCASDNAGTRQARTEAIEHLRRENPLMLESVELWDNEYGPGLKLTTAHYEIFTTFLEPTVLRHSPGFMESVYRAYNSQLPEPIETQNKFTVYLFGDRRQWEDFTRDFAGEQAETFCRIKAGAYYHNGACVAYDIGPQRTLSVLGHEGWHQFNGRHFKFRLPSWLDEGVAMLFETNGTEEGTFSLEPAKNTYRLNALKRTLANNKMIPLRDLIVSNPGDVLATDRTEAVMAFYSQSYALVRFLQEADGGRRLDAYYRLLADGLRGDWPLDKASRNIAADRNIPRNILWNHIVGLVLFQDYIGYDCELIEQEYLAFCRQIVAD
ncbi:MAG: hypothetical protein U9Q07_05925 [Planctomycetota bacterium]|nr:hypothetical protein [Planctomycetota bacterium]